MEEERENLPVIADDFLIQVADQAERRVDAVMKIKRVALKVTNARDWTDQNGNPYLQVSGSEKIANLFNISWRIDEPLYEEEANGHFTWTYKGYFTLGGRSIEAIGTRSSKDAFFNKYEYIKVEGKADERKILPPSAIDKGDVKKAALTNLFGNGITRILGIRNLTWDDLKEFAGILQEQVQGVQYKKGGNGKKPVDMPKEKAGGNPSIVSGIDNVTFTEGKKDGKPWKKYTVHIGDQKISTFSDTFGKEATRAKETSLDCRIEYKQTQFGMEVVKLEVIEPPTEESH